MVVVRDVCAAIVAIVVILVVEVKVLLVMIVVAVLVTSVMVILVTGGLPSLPIRRSLAGTHLSLLPRTRL